MVLYSGNEKMREIEIRQMDAVSFAKLCALINGGIGLFYAIFFSVVFGVLGFNAGGQISIAGGFNIFSAIVAVIFFPLLFAFFGAVFGFLFSPIYNLAVRKLGGLKIRIS